MKVEKIIFIKSDHSKAKIRVFLFVQNKRDSVKGELSNHFSAHVSSMLCLSSLPQLSRDVVYSNYACATDLFSSNTCRYHVLL